MPASAIMDMFGTEHNQEDNGSNENIDSLMQSNDDILIMPDVFDEMI